MTRRQPDEPIVNRTCSRCEYWKDCVDVTQSPPTHIRYIRDCPVYKDMKFAEELEAILEEEDNFRGIPM